MKVLHELYYWNTPGERRYRVLEDSKQKYFAVRNVNNIVLPKHVIDYTQNIDNPIVKIYEQGEWIVTEFLQDYQPVIIRGSCDYYEDLRVRDYNEYFSSPERCARYYTRIVEAYIHMKERTGWCFSDRTGTNIMVNRGFKNFRIIDVMSLEPASQLTVFPVSEFFYPSEWGKALAHKHGLIRPRIDHIPEVSHI